MATINMYVEDIATQKRSGRLLLPDSVLTQTLIKRSDLLSEVLRSLVTFTLKPVKEAVIVGSRPSECFGKARERFAAVTLARPILSLVE